MLQTYSQSCELHVAVTNWNSAPAAVSSTWQRRAWDGCIQGQRYTYTYTLYGSQVSFTWDDYYLDNNDNKFSYINKHILRWNTLWKMA